MSACHRSFSLWFPPLNSVSRLLSSEPSGRRGADVTVSRPLSAVGDGVEVVLPRQCAEGQGGGGGVRGERQEKHRLRVTYKPHAPAACGEERSPGLRGVKQQLISSPHLSPNPTSACVFMVTQADRAMRHSQPTESSSSSATVWTACPPQPFPRYVCCIHVCSEPHKIRLRILCLNTKRPVSHR